MKLAVRLASPRTGASSSTPTSDQVPQAMYANGTSPAAGTPTTADAVSWDPSRVRSVQDGTSPVYGLWNVPDLGYLSYVVADKLIKGEITGKEGETFTVPSLNKGAPYTIGKDGVVILGPAFRFDKTNLDVFF